MIGQEKFLSKLNQFTINTLPHSMLILGDHGAGQYEVCEYIQHKFDFPILLDISENISTEYLNQIYLSANRAIYTIDITKITEKEQNILLKLFEEPNAFTYIILYGDSIMNILDTIVNRSYVMQMDKYTSEQLEQYVTGDYKDYILQICNTPGQIEVANHTNIPELQKLCTNFITRLANANFANTLTIANKINFKDEYNKFDLFLFIRALIYEMIKLNQFELYDDVEKLDKNIWFMNDKKRYFESFLIDAWFNARG